MAKKKNNKKHFVIFALLVLAGAIFYFGGSLLFPTVYNVASAVDQSVKSDVPQEPEKFVATHIKTPDSLRGVYMTSWVSGTPSIRSKVIELVDNTEINAIIIDIKDDTGRVSYAVEDPFLKELGSEEVRIADLRELIALLHEKNIYVAGRIAVFQDPYMVKKFPERAVKKASDGSIWRDRKGLSWIDAGNKDHWDYIVALSKDAYAAGFDEINFDYVRFPSDGNMNDIYYPKSEGAVKSEVIKNFFAYLHSNLEGEGIATSVDLFGMTTTNTDDLNIGQIIEDAFPYFDYIAPMVYPSHYPSGFYGYKNVNSVPYDIVKISMQSAVDRLKVYNDTIASTTVQLRPWLQDNDYPVPYTKEMVRAQIQATYDVGLNSWMLWDAKNTYTRSALLPE